MCFEYVDILKLSKIFEVKLLMPRLRGIGLKSRNSETIRVQCSSSLIGLLIVTFDIHVYCLRFYIQLSH